jgi:hypothetical protein
MSKYRKFVVAAVAIAAVAGKAYADGHIDPAEWGEIAIAAATALGVWAVPNKPTEGR